MGIKGLETFIDENYHLQLVKVTGKLVIDGSGLFHHLYKHCHGSHHCFHDEAKRFFTILKSCGIRPMVIFDGLQVGKDETRIKRKNSQYFSLNAAQMREGQCSHDCRGWWTTGCSVLGGDVFRHSSDLDCEIIVAEGEADRKVVDHARKNKCPVLGHDSDFAIFDIPHGYIPFKGFKWEEASPTEGGVMAEVFRFEQFAHSIDFPSQLCLLFPAILGNDQIQALNTDPRAVVRISKLYRQHSFGGLLSVMEGVNPESAILEGIPREKLLANCKEAKMFYDLDGAPLIPPEFPRLPPWTLEQFRSGRLHTAVVQVLAERFCILSPQREDFDRPDTSHSISKMIRACTYGILLGSDQMVEEVVRSPGKASVEYSSTTTKMLDRPATLDTIECMEEDIRKQVLCDVLSCNFKDIKRLEPKWQLAAAATQFWSRETKPKKYITTAIVACFIYCDSGKDTELQQARFSYNFYLEVLHALAQWQQVYLDTLTLNQVLKEPFECTELMQFFDGDIVMYFALKLDRAITILQRGKDREDISELVSLIETAAMRGK